MNTSIENADEVKDQGNPSKKRKVDSLLLAIKQRDLTKLKILVHEEVDVENIGNISPSNGFTYQKIPALFAAIITDQLEMVKFLVNCYQHLPLKKNEERTADNGFILPTDSNEHQNIDVFDLVGSACILFGAPGAYNYGLSCLKIATKIRFPPDGKVVPMLIDPQSEVEKLLFKGQCEVLGSQELELLEKKPKFLKTQAFFICRRILKKLGLYPNRFIVYGLCEFTLKQNRLDPSRVFISSLFLIELCGTSSFLEELVENPGCSYNVLNLTLFELKRVLEDQTWTQLSMYEPESVLNFNNLMLLLNFVFAYQVKVKNLWTNEVTKTRRLEDVSNLILVILKLMVEVVKTKIQRRKLISILETHVKNYEKKNPMEESILLALSLRMHMDSNDCKVALLMLEVGSTFEECRVENNVGFEIILRLFQNFRSAILLTEKKALQTKKWDAVNSCVSFVLQFLKGADVNVLGFNSLMLCLEFSFELLLNMYEGYFPINEMVLSSSTWPFDEDQRFSSMDKIADLAISTLKLIQSTQRTNAEITTMKKRAELFFTDYQEGKNERKPCLLLKSCLKPPLEIDFKMIQFLLEAGATHNVFDSQQGSILHVLMKKELSLKTYWRVENVYIDYPERAKAFTKAVKTILNGSFHHDQVDYIGKTAFECFKGTYLQYPDHELRNILGSFFHRVSPLSCIAAKIIRKNRLPACARLPDSLQSFVAFH